MLGDKLLLFECGRVRRHYPSDVSKLFSMMMAHMHWHTPIDGDWPTKISFFHSDDKYLKKNANLEWMVNAQWQLLAIRKFCLAMPLHLNAGGTVIHVTTRVLQSSSLLKKKKKRGLAWCGHLAQALKAPICCFFGSNKIKSTLSILTHFLTYSCHKKLLSAH